MSSETPPALLFRALGANALFSLVSALILFAAGSTIAHQIGLPPGTSLDNVAILLALFAAQLGSIVVFRRLYVLEIALIIVADLAWVVVSGVGLTLYGAQMTDVGQWLVGGVALAVLVFAELQGWGLLRWKRSGYVRA